MSACADIVQVLAGDRPLAEKRREAWGRVGSKAAARRAARVMGMTQAAAAAAYAKREQRQAGRARSVDLLLARTPGWLTAFWLRASLRRAYEACQFRTATHGHSIVIGEGAPDATSATSTAWPSEVGLPNSYRQPVTLSEHVLAIPRSWLRDVKARGAATTDEGRLVLQLALEPDALGNFAAKCVRQGRGTGLVVHDVCLRQDSSGQWQKAKSREQK